MEYKRLTEKDSCYYDEMYYDESNRLGAEDIYNRLAELEDKIEQGTLREQKTCKNISEMHPADGFTCSECGITVIDFREERVDEEDCTASWYEYEMKYCPNCGAKVVE